jgi:lipopolysaccharide export system permease protein
LKTLHRYLTGQVLGTLLMTVAVFTFVLLLGNALKDILLLLVNRQATLGMVAEAFGLLIPWVLAFALPMGMLTAALLVFGRFSADQELTAVRSSGVSLVALVSPILLLSLLLCGVCAFVNMEVAPRCRVAYIGLRYEMGARLASAGLPEGRFVADFPGYIFYVDRNDRGSLRGVRIYELGAAESTTYAPRGYLVTTNGQTSLHLEGGVKGLSLYGGTLHPWSTETAEMGPFDFKTGGKWDQKPGLSDMTFEQLQAQLKELDGMFSRPGRTDADPEELRHQLLEMQQMQRDMTMPVLVQMNRQVAFSFACFGFTLVGIPLGIRAHRRETNVGFFMALLLVLIYYSFMILGQSLETHTELAPHLIMWLPNFIFQAVGAVMLWRANRGLRG